MQTKRPEPGPRHRALEPLVGVWRTHGTTIESESEPAIPFAGTDTYEWLEGGLFLLHKVDVSMGDRPVVGVEIIYPDPVSGHYHTWSVDADGTTEGYEARIEGRVWSMTSRDARFRGAFAEDGGAISGLWERRNGADWEPWMTVTLSRV